MATGFFYLNDHALEEVHARVVVEFGHLDWLGGIVPEGLDEMKNKTFKFS